VRGASVHLVTLIYPISLVYPNQRDKPNKPDQLAASLASRDAIYLSHLTVYIDEWAIDLSEECFYSIFFTAGAMVIARWQEIAFSPGLSG
jgi:hypothetical protein